MTVFVASKETYLVAFHAGLFADVNDFLSSPVSFSWLEDRRLAIKPESRIPAGLTKKLTEAGIEKHSNASYESSYDNSLDEFDEADNWAEVFPLEHNTQPSFSNDYIFEVSGVGFLKLASEFYRLGCDRMSYLVLEDAHFLRVTAPPHYSLIKAKEYAKTFVYQPSSPGSRVWISHGLRHPCPNLLLVEPSHIAFIQGGHKTITSQIPDGPWSDIYEATDLVSPLITEQETCEIDTKVSVSLRLVRSRYTPPRLWEITQDPLVHLENLVKTLPEQELSKFTFCVAADQQSAIIKVKDSSARSFAGISLPEHVAVPYSPISTLAHVYVPVGKSIDPPLRPQRLGEVIFQGRHDHLLLVKDLEHALDLHAISHSAFRDLLSFVEYRIHSLSEYISSWVSNSTYNFDPFVAYDIEWKDGPPAVKPPPSRPSSNSSSRKAIQSDDDLDDDGEEGEEEVDQDALDDLYERYLSLGAKKPELSELEQQALDLQSAFCEDARPLHHPSRVSRWVQLGTIHRQMGHDAQALLCWSRALWGLDKERSQVFVEQICKALFEDVDEDVFLADILAYVSADNGAESLQPTSLDIQKAAMFVISRSGNLGEHLDALVRFFDVYESTLDHRSQWLVRMALSMISGQDKLMMLRAKDAITSQLGSSAAITKNVPTFIRHYQSDAQGEDVDMGSSGVLALHAHLDSLYQYFAAHDAKRTKGPLEENQNPEITHHYLMLVFAWGHAKLGQSDKAQEFLNKAQAIYDRNNFADDSLHSLMTMAYRSKIVPILDGGVAGGLDIQVQRERADIKRFHRYKFDRVQEASRIINPNHDIDPFEAYSRAGRSEHPVFDGINTGEAEPSDLPAIFDKAHVLAAAEQDGKRAVAIYKSILNYAMLLSEAEVVKHIRLALSAIDSISSAEYQYHLISELSKYTLHLQSDDSILDASILSALTELTDKYEFNMANRSLLLAVSSTMSDSAHLIERQNQTVQAHAFVLKMIDALPNEHEYATAHLQLAAALARLGEPSYIDKAFSIALTVANTLAVAARSELIDEMCATLKSTNNHQVVIAGTQQLFEFFNTTCDTYSTSSHVSLSVLSLFESLIGTIAAENVSLSPWALSWISEDEQLLRNKIFADLKTL